MHFDTKKRKFASNCCFLQRVFFWRGVNKSLCLFYPVTHVCLLRTEGPSAYKGNMLEAPQHLTAGRSDTKPGKLKCTNKSKQKSNGSAKSSLKITAKETVNVP